MKWIGLELRLVELAVSFSFCTKRIMDKWVHVGPPSTPGRSFDSTAGVQ